MNDQGFSGETEYDPRSISSLLVRIAYMYYIEGETQETIGTRLGISRQKVQRLLKQAHKQGIVEIRIVPSPDETIPIASEIKSRFNLQEVRVAPAHPNLIAQRRAVAQEAAGFLELFIKDRMVIAVGMGSNTGEIPNFLQPKRVVDCTFVPAIGGSPSVELDVNSNEICRNLAMKFGGKAEMLYAPAFVESTEMRNMLVKQETVRQTLELAAQADCAIIGIGGTDDNCTLVRSGCFSVREIRQLRKNNAVGDFLGNYFDIYGNIIPSELYGRLIGLTLSDLKRINNNICVVSEPYKATSILGALRSGIVCNLILDANNAHKILELNELYPCGGNPIPTENP